MADAITLQPLRSLPFLSSRSPSAPAPAPRADDAWVLPVAERLLQLALWLANERELAGMSCAARVRRNVAQWLATG
ncbi:MAG: hypothetical protein ACK40A_19400, partial [Pannonibacter indicus]